MGRPQQTVRNFSVQTVIDDFRRSWVRTEWLVAVIPSPTGPTSGREENPSALNAKHVGSANMLPIQDASVGKTARARSKQGLGPLQIPFENISIPAALAMI